MKVEYLELADYLAVAQAVTGLDLQTVINITNADLADSALHAPSAGFGDDDFYPDFTDKAAVLLVRLARNHPLPDGNKRAAWVSLRLFVDVTIGDGTPGPRSMTPKLPCWPSPPGRGTKQQLRLGCEHLSGRLPTRLSAHGSHRHWSAGPRRSAVSDRRVRPPPPGVLVTAAPAGRGTSVSAGLG